VGTALVEFSKFVWTSPTMFLGTQLCMNKTHFGLIMNAFLGFFMPSLFWLSHNFVSLFWLSRNILAGPELQFVLAEPQLCIPLLAQPKCFGWARTLWPSLKQHALIPPFH